jgi:hypothetical protein
MIWYRHPMSGKLTTGPQGAYDGRRHEQRYYVENAVTEHRDRREAETASLLGRRVRICAADACASGTVGAYLRREGIYSSQLYAWRRERERGDLDAGALRKRKAREAERG